MSSLNSHVTKNITSFFVAKAPVTDLRNALILTCSSHYSTHCTVLCSFTRCTRTNILHARQDVVNVHMHSCSELIIVCLATRPDLYSRAHFLVLTMKKQVRIKSTD